MWEQGNKHAEEAPHVCVWGGGVPYHIQTGMLAWCAFGSQQLRTLSAWYTHMAYLLTHPRCRPSQARPTRHVLQVSSFTRVVLIP